MHLKFWYISNSRMLSQWKRLLKVFSGSNVLEYISNSRMPSQWHRLLKVFSGSNVLELSSFAFGQQKINIPLHSWLWRWIIYLISMNISLSFSLRGQHDHSWSNPAFNTCIEVNKLKLLIIIGIDTTTLSWWMMCTFQNTRIKGQKKVETLKHLKTGREEKAMSKRQQNEEFLSCLWSAHGRTSVDLLPFSLPVRRNGSSQAFWCWLLTCFPLIYTKLMTSLNCPLWTWGV